MIRVAIRTKIQLAWIKVNYPNRRRGDVWWESRGVNRWRQASWVYIECDDAEAAQIALTLGTEVEHYEPI